MSESTKHQPYTYSLKTVAYVGQGTDICTNMIAMYIVPPDNALTIENLYMHVVMQFDAGVPSGDRVLRRIGIYDEFVNPNIFGQQPNRAKMFDVNIAADVNRMIDKRIDLSALLKKDDVLYRELLMPLGSPETGYTYIMLEFDSDQAFNNLLGSIKLWKADALYTTVGIV